MFSVKSGELIEKATRVLSPEEQRIFDTDWVGKDGSKRKLEVGDAFFYDQLHTNQPTR